jgi:polyhydroxyalkanoate synthase
LRNCYLDNNLSKGAMKVAGITLDLHKVKVPVYNLATREDHIAPAKSVLEGSKYFGGPVKYVLSGSGHIAGVVNPPSSNKYQYWTNDTIKDISLTDWVKGAQEHKGSWWPNWREWLGGTDAEEVPARHVGTDALPPIEDAPGSYVRVRA